MKNVIEINGEKYIKKEQKKTPKLSPLTSSILMMGAMMYSLPFDTGEQRTKTKKPEQQVNIVSEFELIQQKKSKLTRSQREWVVYMFNKNFKKLM